MQKKSELRCALLAARSAISADQRLLLDSRIAVKILEWWNVRRVKTLGVYWPMRDEPDLHALYATLHAQGVQLALPVVVADDSPLRFVAWTPGEAMLRDRFGTCVPALPKNDMQPEALLIPCLGFTRERFRLGYGGGFYDRTLAPATRPFTVGVAYANGETVFAVDAYDIALDIVITDASVFSGSAE